MNKENLLKSKPIVGVTMGDPAGIGPEIVCKSILEPRLHSACRPVVIGSASVLEQVSQTLKTGQTICVVEHPQEATYDPHVINVVDLPLDYAVKPGKLCVENGKYSIQYMDKAHDLLQSGLIDATSSAPCNKEAMKLAGLPCVGATEYYALLAKVQKSFAVIEQSGCYMFQMTSHKSLRQATELITYDLTRETLLTAHRTLQKWGIAAPRLALSALNPHAGDGGTMGTEEVEILKPALDDAARTLGCEIAGPIPADSIYIKGTDGAYDGIIFLLHDTCNIPVKLMEKTAPSVVITGGLPFVRTTVAHGTAYDIAWKGIAGHGQLCNAILASARISARLKGQ